MNKHFVITIAREFGSGGKEIGVKVGELLGIPCYEKEIITKASEYSGLNEELFEQVDEKLRGNVWGKKLLNVPARYVITPEKKAFVSDDNLFHFQRKIIEKLARTQSCVIIGKCADFILWNDPFMFNVFIGAPFCDCVRSISERLHVSEEKAAKMVRTTNQYRADYYRYYTGGRDWKDPLNYFMYLNSSQIGRQQCAELIATYTRNKFRLDEKQI